MSTKKQVEIIPVGEELPPLRPPEPAPRNEPQRPKTRRESERAEPTDAGERKRRALARFAQINAFCDETLSGLERAELAVWLLLWRETRSNGRARVAQTDLARRAGCAERTVRRALESLCVKGLVRKVYQGGWPRRMTIYRVAAVAENEAGK